jgi:1,4-dihydroxy-2-naphthoyl-CoA synthase
MEWQRSGPEPGQGYSDTLYDAAEITINRPEVRDAFRPASSRTRSASRGDPKIGVIILTGAPHFLRRS